MSAYTAPMFDTIATLACGGRSLKLDRPRIAGVLNLTDDSFSGDGLRNDVDAALARGVAMVEQGADCWMSVASPLDRVRTKFRCRRRNRARGAGD